MATKNTEELQQEVRIAAVPATVFRFLIDPKRMKAVDGHQRDH